MELNISVSNPLLVGSIELLKAEDTPEHRNMMINELMKAKLLSPVVITPEPEADENGKTQLKPGSKLQFPMLNAPDGKQFFMAFTDRSELVKWKQEQQHTFALSFDDYAAMLLKKDNQGNTSPALGFVLNPFGSNIVISKEMVANLLMQKLQKQGKAVPPGKAVSPGKPGTPGEV